MGMTSLLDIVAPQTFGNSRVPLLWSVTIPQETKHKYVVEEFKYMNYLEVESGNYRTIKVDIYRDKREQVAIEGGKVIVTLNLKKRLNDG